MLNAAILSGKYKCLKWSLDSHCRLFEVVETLGRVHLVTEWIQGGELYNRITQDGPLKEIYAASLFKQLLLAVQHMVRSQSDVVIIQFQLQSICNMLASIYY